MSNATLYDLLFDFNMQTQNTRSVHISCGPPTVQNVNEYLSRLWAKDLANLYLYKGMYVSRMHKATADRGGPRRTLSKQWSAKRP